MQRTVRLLVATALLATLAVVLPGGASAAAASGDESALFSMVNSARSAAGVPALTLDSGLSSVARSWAQTMATQDGISHNPDLKAQVPSNWRKTGENVGMGPTVAIIHDLLMKSPHHYDNIVDGEFQRIGIGIVTANRTVWVVEDFLAVSGSPAPAPAPAPAAAPAPAPVVRTPPPTVPLTTSTTTTLPPTTTSTTTTTTLPAAPPPALSLRLTQVVQQLQALRARS